MFSPGQILTGRRLGRAAGAAVALSAGLAIAVVPGSTHRSLAGATVLSPSAAACATESATSDSSGGSRVRPGTHTADPDTLTADQVAAVEARTRARAERQGLSANARGQLSRTTTASRTGVRSQSAARLVPARIAAAQPAFTPTTVAVYWHVITNGKSGKLSSTAINTQISVLNAAYKTAGFSFKLARTDTTTNADWFNTTGPTGSGSDGDAADAKAMKTTLHVGGRSVLNVYTVAFSDGTLGYSSFPFAGSPALDGDVIDYRSLPGGSFTGYNLGDTATHEIGHWFGLYHTFQGGCSATRGDYVSDTPAEAYPAWDCTAKDSCPSLPGTDPIKNFMDYAPDACMNTFTPGQRTRMQNQWLTYRAPKV